MDISYRMLKAGSTVENYDFEIFLNKNNPIFIKDNGGLVKENNNYLKN